MKKGTYIDDPLEYFTVLGDGIDIDALVHLGQWPCHEIEPGDNRRESCMHDTLLISPYALNPTYNLPLLYFRMMVETGLSTANEVKTYQAQRPEQPRTDPHSPH